MTPRPYKPDPSYEVFFGRWPFKEAEGIVPDGERLYHENPPDARRGITLVRRRGKNRYYKKLRGTDQLSQAEAAAVLRVSRMQVNRWVRDGVIRDRKVLGTSRIKVAELITFARKKGMAFF
jgi:excisionase family DNA binding protein